MKLKARSPQGYVDWCKSQISKVRRNAPKYFRSSVTARFLSVITDEAIEKNRMNDFACARGCAWCCYVQTDVFSGEAFVLADAVRKMPTEQREMVVERLRDNAEKFAKMSLFERESAKIPCALLDLNKSTCSVYESRPRACRRWHSLDADACKSGFETPGSTTPVDSAALNAADLAGIAYKEVTKEPIGELHQGVLLALSSGAERRFAKGEPVFEGWTSTEHSATEEEKRDLEERVISIMEEAERVTCLRPR